MSSKKPKSLIDMSRAVAGAPPKEVLEAFLSQSHHPEYDFYDRKMLRAVKVLDANVGSAEFEFVVTTDMCNANGVLHGGCAATILDNLTSLTVATEAKRGFMEIGSVSRTLTCTYHRAVKPGEKVKVVCRTLSVGKTMCHVSGEILTEDGKVAVSCAHDKVVRKIPKL